MNRISAFTDFKNPPKINNENCQKNSKGKPIGEDEVIIDKIHYETTIDKEGNEIKKRIVERKNITRLINETAKVIKNEIANDKLAEIKKVLGE